MTTTDSWNAQGAPVTVELEARPERRLIRSNGSTRYVDFKVWVRQAAPRVPADRLPLNLALVIDRSGSMMGEPLATAKRAALAAVERLDERDNVALVIFDERIDVLHALAAVTPRAKAQLRSTLETVEARGTTALHEGWLTGCQAIAADQQRRHAGRLSRCFLLTDGLANVGLTDPELIASEAAGIRQNAGISTSTFGIGPNYDEFLLGPMAVAGGGQFHHLRSPAEIATTFVGELGELLAVAASDVQLELELTPTVTVEVVSQYWTSQTQGIERLTISIGDLLDGEERHVVAGLRFPPRGQLVDHTVRARVSWSAGAARFQGAWQSLRFSYADTDACNREPHDAEAMQWIARHQADRGIREATRLSRQGDARSAQAVLRAVQGTVQPYAAHDAQLQEVAVEIDSLSQELAAAPLAPMSSKEAVARSQRRSRGQRDYRQ